MAENWTVAACSNRDCRLEGKWWAWSCSAGNVFKSLETAIDFGKTGSEKWLQSWYGERDESSTDLYVLDGEHWIVEPGAFGQPLPLDDKVETNARDNDDTVRRCSC